MADPHTERLADALQAEGLTILAVKARTEFFSDHKSPHPTPKMALMRELRLVGRDKLAKRVMQGEFDG